MQAIYAVPADKKDRYAQVLPAIRRWAAETDAELEAAIARQTELAEQLRLADRRKDEFLALLAHELRNPLAPIRNSVQVLRIKGPADPVLVSARDIIARQVDHLSRLVDDLLDVARISRGRIELKKERLDLEVVVTSAVEALRPQFEAARHELFEETGVSAEVLEHRRATGKIVSFPGAATLPNIADVLEVDCDVLLVACTGEGDRVAVAFQGARFFKDGLAGGAAQHLKPPWLRTLHCDDEREATAGALFACFLDLKAPRFVTSYSALEAGVRSTTEQSIRDRTMRLQC